MMDEYEVKVRQQIKQYEAGIDEFPLPRIFHYYSHNFLRNKVASVFKTQSNVEFYASQFASLYNGNSPLNIISIGSGDGSQEIEIARALLTLGVKFNMVGLDLLPDLVKQANGAAKAVGLEGVFSAKIFDFNKHDIEIEVDGFMAHHSLHHILELERLFDLIKRTIKPNGLFLTQDMIGRNGHMRWPETLAIVESVWDIIDERKKYHHQFKKTMHKYENYDCSHVGFEGIRAQDILPLLLERFSFSKFVGCGGLIDVFTDRGYGPNFDPTDLADRCFI